MCHPKGRSATVRHARRRSGERHERSIPRPPALPAPLADPPIAPQPTHTRLRRALLLVEEPLAKSVFGRVFA